MHIEKQINGYCDIAELILWLDANIKTMNYARHKTNPDSEDINYDILLQKLKESRYLNIHSFEEAFNDLQDFFSSKDREICPEPKPMNPDVSDLYYRSVVEEIDKIKNKQITINDLKNVDLSIIIKDYIIPNSNLDDKSNDV